MHKVIAAWAFPFPIFGLTGDQSPLNTSNHKQNQKIGNLAQGMQVKHGPFSYSYDYDYNYE